MSRPWIVDMTLRPPVKPEVSVEPDGTVELSWERVVDGAASALTLLLSPDIFGQIIDQGRELRMLGRLRETANAGSRK